MAVATTANSQHLTRTTNLGIAGHARFTLCGWGNYTSVVNDADLMAAEHTSNGRRVTIGTSNAGLFRIQDSQTGTTVFAQSPALNQWFFFALVTTLAAGPMYGYWSPLGSDRWWMASRTNGVETSVQAERVSLLTANGSATNFRGRIENCMAFNRSLTFTDLCLQKRQAMPVSRAQLYGWWPLESVVRQVIDLSGNHRNLTATGTLSDYQGTRLSVLASDNRQFWMAPDVAGRTTKNTRAFPLGMEVGMNWRGNI